METEHAELHNPLNMFGTKEAVPTPSRPVDNPLIYLTQPSGDKVAYYDIFDIVWGVVNVNERFV